MRSRHEGRIDDGPRSQRGPSGGSRRRLVVQVMCRPAEAIRESGGRKRCTRGWQGQSCKKRTCEVCGVVWARDWRRVLFEALQAPGVPVVLSAVTPPGAKELPWDEWHCAHLGPHRHSARLGCRVEGEALAAWSRDISKRWKRRSQRARGTRASARWGGVCRSRRGRGSHRREGRGTCTRCSTSTRRRTSRSRGATCGTWRGSAPRHGFGFVGEKHGKSMQIMSGDRAAAYLSSYFVRGKGSEGDAAGERAQSAPAADADLGFPRSQGDRCHDAESSSLSAALGGRMGFLPPPSWSGVELHGSCCWRGHGRCAGREREGPLHAACCVGPCAHGQASSRGRPSS